MARAVSSLPVMRRRRRGMVVLRVFDVGECRTPVYRRVCRLGSGRERWRERIAVTFMPCACG
ncbi:hypothetical protein GCM10027359_11770 [Marilutibacter aestuarii]